MIKIEMGYGRILPPLVASESSVYFAVPTSITCTNDSRFLFSTSNVK